jgi:hypothetical protein
MQSRAWSACENLDVGQIRQDELVQLRRGAGQSGQGESLVARLPGRVLAAGVMQQPGRDLCEFGERGLELALDRKLVLALVQTTPSGPQIAERQR